MKFTQQLKLSVECIHIGIFMGYFEPYINDTKTKTILVGDFRCHQ